MKVGDYVRTDDGIKKIIKYEYRPNYENCHCVWFDTNVYGILFTDEEVNKMKPSPNIIDLIEVGDYVNHHRVVDIELNNNDKTLYLYVDTLEYNEVVYQSDIKSIVTKEQFERMEYKIC